MTNKITLDIEIFNQLLNVAQSCITKDQTRLLLQYAKVVVKENELIVVSCNGYKMARLKITLCQDVQQDFEFYIKPFTVPKNVAIAEIEKKENNVEISLIGAEWKTVCIMPQPQGDFINADKIFPQTDDNLTVYVNAKTLIEVLKLFTKPTSKHNLVQMNFVKADCGISKVAPIVLSSKRNGSYIETLVLPIRGD